ncbi:MAG: hypothetical protein LBH24_04545 [Clostridiales bacterium]|jgi:hypothetical protein|nr:hypothetical protein [Clostridiales bacterium]
MRFQNSVTVLGKGQPVSAVRIGGEYRFVIDRAGALIEKRVDTDARQAVYRPGGTVSYAPAYVRVPGGGVRCDTDLTYEPDPGR